MPGDNAPTINDRGTHLTRTLPLLCAWFLLALWLGVTDRLGAAGRPPIGLGLAIALPLLVGAIDRRRGGPLFSGLRQLDLATLIALQTFRVGGALFVVGFLAGALPAGFALPAGLGDVAVGLSAAFVAAAVSRRAPGHRRLAVIWNLLGLADLITAVLMGVTHSSSSFGVFASAVTTDALARYPFSLIPTFFVPLAAMLHLAALRRLTVQTST